MTNSVFYNIIKVCKIGILLLSLFFFVEGYIVGLTVVSGESMMNTIKDNDRILVNKISYLFEKPSRGDVVIFNPPIEGREHEFFIKRIIGVAGDFFEIKDNLLYINGRPVAENYININKSDKKDFKLLEGMVPEGYVYVLGDNRDNSNDSRVFGFVPMENLRGKAITKVWPIGGIESLAVHYEDNASK